MNCNPPKSKIANYEFRFLKVTKDVAWHLMGVKRCTPPTVMPGNGGNGGNRYRRAFDFEQIDEEFSLNFEHDFQAFIVGYLSENRPLEGARLKSAGEGSGDFEGDQGSPGIARSSVVGQSPVNELEEFNYEDAKGKTSGNEKKLNALAKRCKVNMDK